ncbi:MAG: hypothetical protein ACRD1C_01900 [Terriglobales bacterium]
MKLRALRARALNWAHFLLALRDGRQGVVYFVSCESPPRWFAVAKILPTAGGKGAETQEYWLSASRARDEVKIVPPTLPCPEAWGILAQARSVKRVCAAAGIMARWKLDPMGLQDAWQAECVQGIRAAAGALVKAVRLPSYPRSRRPTSADSRVLFLAKVLAGHQAGLRPLTALKRLAGLTPPVEMSRQHASAMIPYRLDSETPVE